MLKADGLLTSNKNAGVVRFEQGQTENVAGKEIARFDYGTHLPMFFEVENF
ncbi:MAG: hypothetical protein ACLU4N_18040 [Butyricimonas faecihominis]